MAELPAETDYVDVGKKIAQLSKATASRTTAGLWFKLAQTIDSEELRQEILKAAGAALVADGAFSAYRTTVKPMLADVDYFEVDFIENCRDCDGSGKTRNECPICYGSGRCGNCGGMGRFRVESSNGTFQKKYARCQKCSGTGKCPKCKGEGGFEEVCANCKGRIMTVNKDRAITSYRNHVRDASVLCKREIDEVREREKIAQQEAKWEAERERERLNAEERERQQQERETMRERGLVFTGGKWMTPGSMIDMRYKVEKFLSPVNALCIDTSRRQFCLLMTEEEKTTLKEGMIIKGDLYRCADYLHKDGLLSLTKKIPKFCTDLELAEREILSDKAMKSKR